MSLSLRCREDDQTPDQDFSVTDRNNMQFRAFSSGQYMTTYVDSEDLYENEGVTIAEHSAPQPQAPRSRPRSTHATPFAQQPQ